MQIQSVIPKTSYTVYSGDGTYSFIESVRQKTMHCSTRLIPNDDAILIDSSNKVLISFLSYVVDDEIITDADISYKIIDDKTQVVLSSGLGINNDDGSYELPVNGTDLVKDSYYIIEIEFMTDHSELTKQLVKVAKYSA